MPKETEQDLHRRREIAMDRKETATEEIAAIDKALEVIEEQKPRLGDYGQEIAHKTATQLDAYNT